MIFVYNSVPQVKNKDHGQENRKKQNWRRRNEEAPPQERKEKSEQSVSRSREAQALKRREMSNGDK
jgi:hypothetical protein